MINRLTLTYNAAMLRYMGMDAKHKWLVIMADGQAMVCWLD